MLLASILCIIGFFLLIKSADLLVDNATILAKNLGMSTFLVGIIIIGFGTSAPEMFVSFIAALENKGNLALGNALGSNITNIGLVLGFACITNTLPVARNTIIKEIPIMIFFALLLFFLLLDTQLSHINGAFLLISLIIYLIWVGKKTPSNANDSSIKPTCKKEKSALKKAAIIVALSILTLVIASEVLVYGATTIATKLGVSDLIIGLTIVAIGTSLPELAAAISAAKKQQHAMIVGNIIGSNIFNTLGVLGITGIVRTTQIETLALYRDFPIMLFFSVLMLVFSFSKGTLSRREGVFLVVAYLGYLFYLVLDTGKSYG